MYSLEQLLLLAEGYAAAHGIALRTVAQRMFGRSNMETFIRISNGQGCRMATAEQAAAWFNAHADKTWWPRGVPWPLEEEVAE